MVCSGYAIFITAGQSVGILLDGRNYAQVILSPKYSKYFLIVSGICGLSVLTITSPFLISTQSILKALPKFFKAI